MSLIRSRVYRGELWDGEELVCKNAHKAIVSERGWKFAQLAGKGGTHVKNGSIAAQGLLTAIASCAACGSRLSLTGSTNRQGERIASYFCRIHHATKGDCPARRSSRPARWTPTSQACSSRRWPIRTRSL